MATPHRQPRPERETPMAMLTGSHSVASLICFFAQVGQGNPVATPEIERRVGLKRTALQKGLERLEKAHLIERGAAGRTNVYMASASDYWKPLAAMAEIEAHRQEPSFDGGFPWLASRLASPLPSRRSRVLRLEATELPSLEAVQAALEALPLIPEASLPRLARAPRPRR